MSNTLSSLKINVTGEALRNIFAIRLKEYDRNIARADAAIAAAKVELVEFEKEADESIRRMREYLGGLPRADLPRADRGITGLGADPVQFKRNIEPMEDQIARIRHNKQLAQWLHDQFSPNTMYELNSYDLHLMGLGHDERVLQSIEAIGVR